MNVRKEGTFEQAQAAQEQFLLDGGDPADPAGPVHQWFSRRIVEAMRREFQSGDTLALMWAVNECARAGLVMPKWLAEEIFARCEQVRTLQVGSWDEVLGRPVPEGKTRATAKKRRLEMFIALNRVEEIRTGYRVPIDEGLFELASESLRMGGHAVKNVKGKYYEARRFDQPQRSSPKRKAKGRRVAIAGPSKKLKK